MNGTQNQFSLTRTASSAFVQEKSSLAILAWLADTLALRLGRAAALWGLLAVAAPTVAQAQFSDPFWYAVTNDTITITGYAGSYDPVVIPSTINDLPITAIGDSAFQGAIMTSLTIPDSVTSIGNRAFADLDYYFGYGPAEVTIPDSVTNLGQYAFESCWGMTNVTIGHGITAIGDGAFYVCSGLTTVAIPNSLTNIGNSAFCFCSGLTRVTIPDGVTSLGSSAFGQCYNLTNVTIGNGVTTIGDAAFQLCSGLTSVTIGSRVNTIGNRAFDACSGLTRVTIPDSVTSLGQFAFVECSALTNVTIGDRVTSINGAFQYCYSLASVTIGSSVTSIVYAAFDSCGSLTRAYFKGNPPSLDGLDFGDTSPTIYYLPGATGWPSTFAGLPALLWNPLIQSGGENFGLRTNCFGFNITGTADIPIQVVACTNLANPVWSALMTGTLTNGSIFFSESMAPPPPARYYRISSY